MRPCPLSSPIGPGLLHSAPAAGPPIALWAAGKPGVWDVLSHPVGWLTVAGVAFFFPRQRGAAFGLMTAVGRLGAILGNTAFGQMSAADPRLPLFCAGGSLALGSLLGLMLAETRGATIS